MLRQFRHRRYHLRPQLTKSEMTHQGSIQIDDAGSRLGDHDPSTCTATSSRTSSTRWPPQWTARELLRTICGLNRILARNCESPATAGDQQSRGFEPSAPGRIRTCNLLIRSQVLYPLSYGRNLNRRQSLAGTAGAHQNGHPLRVGRPVADSQQHEAPSADGAQHSGGSGI